MPQIRVEENPDYEVTHKVGSITLPYGMRGPELERELMDAGLKFIRDMELRGLELFKGLPKNPQWVKNPDGEYSSWYAIDWLGEHKRTAFVT